MTVKELKEKLAALPDNAKVISAGPDYGGYDFELGVLNIIVVSPDQSVLLLCHESNHALQEECGVNWIEALEERMY